MKSLADAPKARSETSRGARRVSPLTLVLVLAAAVWMLGYLGNAFSADTLGWDVRFAYVPAAEQFLDGNSPYPALDDPLLEDQKGYVYPPQFLFVVSPLAALSDDLAAVLATAAMLALLWLTLHVLDVRDLRCYAVALLWMPVASGVLLANVSIALALAIAIAWRHRNEMWYPATALGLAVSAKLLLWPILVWTLATRRLRATAWAVGIGFAVTAVPWALLGFVGLTGYPALLRRLSEIQSENSYSLVGMSATLGLGTAAGQAVTAVVGGSLLVWCVLLARRGEDFRSFTCAVGATLALSPIVWLHYLVLLLVPVAIARPRLSPLWLLPMLLWVSPRPGYAEGVRTFLPALVAIALLTALLTRPERQAIAAQEPV